MATAVESSPVQAIWWLMQCALQERIMKSKAVVPTKFSWVFNKEVPVIQV